MVNVSHLILRDRVFLHSSCCPVIYYVDQTGALTEVFFLLSPGIKVCAYFKGYGNMCVPPPTCGNQKTTFGALFSPTLVWVAQELRSS